MTKEEIIDNLELYTVGRPKKDRVSITVEELQSLIDEIKALEQQPCDDIMAIHTQGLAEGIRCAMCTNSMKSDSGCDGGCIVDEDMYKKVMDTIENHIVSSVTPTRKVGKWEYKQLGFRKYGLVCTSCGYTIHIGYDFNSMEEFKDMIETKLQNPHITKDKYCCKCGAEKRGNEDENYII